MTCQAVPPDRVKKLVLEYADADEGKVPGHFVRTWRRGEISELKMSTSSGPKPYTCNMIFMAFEKFPGAKYVTMFVARSVPFLIWTLEDGRTVDSTGREVRVAL